MGLIMPTERCSIDKTITGKAERMARDGYDGVHIYKHVGREGLQLRVQKNTAAWVVRYKDYTATIGYLFPERNERPIGGHKEALDIASDVKSVLIDQPERREEYILLRHRRVEDGKGGHRRLTHAEALSALRPNSNTWSLRECVEQMISDREKKDADEPLRPASVLEIRTAFKRPCMQRLMDKPASLVTRGEVETARDEVRKTVGASSAKKLVAWVRSVFGYMAKNHSGQSGITGQDPWWELLHAPYKLKERTRKPAISDIVKSLILAEEYLDKPLPGRTMDRPSVGAGVLSGLWWIVLTCQRSDAAMKLKTYNLVDDLKRGDGWKIASWEAEVMKAGQVQMLPIPPRAAAIVDSIRAKGKNAGAKQWAFPSDRDPDVNASRSGVYRILYRLAGRDALIQPKPDGHEPKLKRDGTPRKVLERTGRRDLLAESDVAWWSLHDVRRTLQEVLDNAGISGGASAVLAHEMKSDVNLTVTMTELERDEFMRQRVAKITNAAYGAAQYPKLKAEAMEIWTNALLDEYDCQKAAATEAIAA
ncbi:hypothetical protein ACFSQT_14155 [Mesorhizobium calcicola]|uniref:Integrase DNA-binding domain-containing protein n=1 Tax=Mesorhizobium calcicola TaxID=1300310 RepID=A0ABW4WFC4_9HYPH